MRILFWLKDKKKDIIQVEIYSKPDCHLCDVAKSVVDDQKAAFPLEIKVVNIEEDPDLFEKYHNDIPVIWINGRKAFKYRVDPAKLFQRLKQER